jgi:hypothetical protein
MCVCRFLEWYMEFSNKDVQMAGQQNGGDQAAWESLPELLIQVPSRGIAGFDCVGRDTTVSINEQEETHGSGSATGNDDKDVVISIPAASTPALNRVYNSDYTPHLPHSVSLSMPSSPSGFHLSQFRTPAARRDEARVAPAEHRVAEEQHVEAHAPRLLRQTRFHSQPILQRPAAIHPNPTIKENEETRRGGSIRDKRFDPFKTFSGRLERQLSNLRGRPQESADGVSPEDNISEEETDQAPAADRYFDALEGPELDKLRVRIRFTFTGCGN